MDPMLASFLQESRENLEAAGHCFLELEKNVGDDELMNDLFRSIHTIKGSSGLFDIGALTRVVHAAEDVLDLAREGEFTVTPDSIDLFLDSLDQVSAWLDDVEDAGTLPDDAEAVGQILSDKLRQLVTDNDDKFTADAETASDAQEESESKPKSLNPPPDWFSGVSHSARLNAYESAIDNKVLAISYTPDEQCFFNGDDPFHSVAGTPQLEWFHVVKRIDWEALETLDPYHCNLVFQLVTTASEFDVRNYFKYVAEQIDITVLDKSQLVWPEGELGDTDIYSDVYNDAKNSLSSDDFDSLQKQILPLLEIGSAELIQTSALAWIKQLSDEAEPSKALLSALVSTLDNGQFEMPDADDDVATSIPKNVTPINNAQNDDMVAPDDISEATQTLIDTQLRILKTSCPQNLLEGRVVSTVALLSKVFNQLHWESLVDGLKQAGDSCVEDASCSGLADYVESCLKGPADASADNTETKPAKTSSSDNAVSVEDIPDATLKLFETQLRILGMPCPDNLLKGRVVSTSQLLKGVFKKLSWDAFIDGLNSAAEASIEQGSCEALATYLQDCMNSSVQATEVKEPEIQQTVAKTETKPADITPASHPMRRAEDKIETAVASKASSKTLRVDQERIDILMDLVGELVVAKNSLPFLARKAEEQYQVKELGKEIKSQYSVINRLSEELQSAMMSVRMVPVSNVFQRFPRLVRDLSRRLDKNIELIMEGEETEADKNVIENLADPLIHLVRNSLDHGIEMPADRKAKGKSEKGTLILRATPMDDQVIIEIIDDGKGIDPNVIKQKAYEKGVIDEERLDSISDQEAVELIFAAGLSSKDEASDLSGRGVGMDVVRTAVLDAGGTVSVTSELDKGSTLRLALPLSMAVAQVMMIEVDSQVYGISMETIRETVRVPADAIERVKHNEAIVLRDKLIPLRRLRDLLGLPKTEQNELKNAEEALLIVSVRGEEIGIVIDDFHEGIDVIQKPLEGVMSNYPIYAGATLLGDGRVLLILDLKELI